ncbi:MAG: hypothetical protein ACI9FJ_000291 [Alteromonadaceae bacterium]|jgi:hypothetical protein
MVNLRRLIGKTTKLLASQTRTVLTAWQKNNGVKRVSLSPKARNPLTKG